MPSCCTFVNTEPVAGALNKFSCVGHEEVLPLLPEEELEEDDEELVEEVEELPEEEEEDDELLEEELEEEDDDDDDELVVVEQTKLELHMVLSKPLLAQHRGVPPRKEQVVL